jgi:hypothetical protein
MNNLEEQATLTSRQVIQKLKEIVKNYSATKSLPHDLENVIRTNLKQAKIQLVIDVADGRIKHVSKIAKQELEDRGFVRKTTRRMSQAKMSHQEAMRFVILDDDAYNQHFDDSYAVKWRNLGKHPQWKEYGKQFINFHGTIGGWKKLVNRLHKKYIENDPGVILDRFGEISKIL